MSRVPASLREQLAPTGVLRVALNHANFLLVSSPAPDGQGVAADLGRGLARRLGVPCEFVGYADAGLVADAAGRDAWDVAFIGADPARAADVEFTPAYVEIEATWLVAPHAPVTDASDVDRPGIRIAVAARSAYHLFLQREVRHATLVLADGLPQSEAVFVRDGLEVLAGLRPHLMQVGERVPGSRVLPGRFMAVQQALGVPAGRPGAAAFAAAFMQEAMDSGLVASLIVRHGVRGLSIPSR